MTLSFRALFYSFKTWLLSKTWNQKVIFLSLHSWDTSPCAVVSSALTHSYVFQPHYFSNRPLISGKRPCILHLITARKLLVDESHRILQNVSRVMSGSQLHREYRSSFLAAQRTRFEGNKPGAGLETRVETDGKCTFRWVARSGLVPS